MCLPRFDGPSVFGALLDRDAGTFRLGPADTMVPAARRYLPGTMILETSWGTDRGWLIVRDVLLVGPWHDTDERSSTHRRAPTDYDADHVLLRTMRCVNGSVEVQMECDPIFDYGRRYAQWEYVGAGYGEAVGQRRRLADQAHADDRPARRLRGLARARRHHAARRRHGVRRARLLRARRAEDLRGGLRPPGQDGRLLAPVARPRRRSRTIRGASTCSARALTLKGLTYSPTGAMIAAATTSLPETPGGVRNWDYRYSWVRDSTFMLWGLHSLGFEWEANDYFYFMQDAAQADDLQVMYGIQGERELPEETLDHLSGYDNARPVRIGNGAYNQRQHDVWGTMLDSIFLHAKSRDHLPERRWPLIERLVEAAIEHWQEPDRGIWEVRGGAAPLHVVEGHVLGGLRPRRPPRAAPRGPRARRALAAQGGRDQGGHHREGLQGRRLHAALRHRRAGRVGAADPARALPAADGRTRAQDGAGDRRPPDGRRARAALPRRGHRRRLQRRRRARSRSARSGS